VTAIVIALIGLAGVLLLPLVNDAIAARRERIKERTRMRETEAESAMKSLRDALDAKDELIEDLREDRNHWRSLHLASQDGWYGQRRRT
jgi:type II secretory pathway pseudopilin PulG